MDVENKVRIRKEVRVTVPVSSVIEKYKAQAEAPIEAACTVRILGLPNHPTSIEFAFFWDYEEDVP